jgi:lipid A 4'-phosphatase
MKGPLLCTVAAFLAALLFMVVPGIDLWVSGLFWSPDTGFFLHDWPPFHWAYALLPTVVWTVVLALMAMLAATIIGERKIGPFDRRTILFLLLAFAVGPGLLANTVFKDHWGRARPSQVTEFGGSKEFTAALVPADQCDHNCSFVSGHGAMAFSLIAFAFVPASRRRRRQIAVAALGFGSFVGLARIAQGGHFLSDTVFAAFLVTGTAWLLHRWVVVGNGLSHPVVLSLAKGVMRAGLGMRDFLARSARSRWRRWLGFHMLCLAGIVVSITWLDRPIAGYFHAENDRLVAWFVWLSQFGLSGGWLTLSGALAVLFILLGRAPRFAETRERFNAWALVPLFVFISVATAGILADIVKIIVGRTRPKLLFSDGFFTWGGLAWQADHWSFPSGHVANATALAAALYFLWPRHVVAYASFVVLIALSRIGSTQHYVSDTIGSVWLAVLVTAYLRGVFLRSGIRLEDAKAGVIPPLAEVSWRRRLLPWRRRIL